MRIIAERGFDFFDKTDLHNLTSDDLPDARGDGDADEDEEEAEESAPKHMTYEELMKMRMEIMPQLLYVSVLYRRLYS